MNAAAPEVRLRRVHAPAFAAECEATATLFIEARRAMLPGLRQVHDEADTRRWMREVVFPRHSVWLADIAGEIVGFAARDGAWLAHLYVKPGLTRRGIGSRLLGAILAEAAPVTPVLRLYTFARNAGARRFYERNGFVVVATGDGTGNEEGEPDVRYERPTRV